MKSNIALVSFFSLLLWSCNNNRTAESGSSSDSKVELSAPAPPSAADLTTKDEEQPGRKFIRSADLKFRVKQVGEVTSKIEDLTSRQGGFVTYTNLSSNVDYVKDIKISADSILQTTYYTVTNNMTIRIPNQNLDSTLKEIAKHATFIDYRIIKADDVALQLLTNKLTQKRAALAQRRLTTNGSKGTVANIYTEETLQDRQAEADNARVANMALNDQINYSTVNLTFYQRQTLKRETIANDANIDEYKPGFGTKAWEALKEGWQGLEDFILFFIQIWWFVLLVIAGIFLFRKYKSRLLK